MDKRLFLILTIIFFIVLFVNSAHSIIDNNNFNPEGEELSTRFYLIGPDSYYNMRTCVQTIENGYYPLYPINNDNLLNYPLGEKGARPPLFNMIAVFFSGGNMELLGWLMLFLPAIYGALTVFPMYYLGKELFGEYVAIASAIFVPLTPLLTGCSHGSALGLFDHDSFIILLMIMMMLFYVRTMSRDEWKSSATITIFCLIAIYLTWVASQTLLLMIAAFLCVKLLLDVYFERYNEKIYYRTLFIFSFTYAITFIYSFFIEGLFNFMLLSLGLVFGVYIVYRIITKIRMNKYMMLTILFGIVGLFVLLTYMSSNLSLPLGPIRSIGDNLFGSGVYKSKVFSTIAEGNVINLTGKMIGIGITIFWFAFGGIFLYFMRERLEQKSLFFFVVFGICMWLTTVAGRFESMIAPLFIFMGIYFSESLIHVFKDKKVLSYAIALIVLIPSIALTTQQIVSPYEPVEEKEWSNVGAWLSKQDMSVSEEKRPAVLSFWDYGFYIVSMSRHPTVSDNYQSGVSPSSSYITATSESEVLATMTIRIMSVVDESIDIFRGNLSQDVKDVLSYHFSDNKLIHILEDPVKYAPSYNTLIAPEWNNTILRVGIENAMYQDAVKEICKLTPVEINMLYLEIVNVTGKKIGYLVVTQKDIEVISHIITYVGDKGVWIVTGEDDYHVGKNMTKKEAFYDTIGYKIYSHSELTYFDYVYESNSVRIVKYRW